MSCLLQSVVSECCWLFTELTYWILIYELIQCVGAGDTQNVQYVNWILELRPTGNPKESKHKASCHRVDSVKWLRGASVSWTSQAEMEAWSVSLHPAHFHLKPPSYFCRTRYELWILNLQLTLEFFKATDISISTQLYNNWQFTG